MWCCPGVILPEPSTTGWVRNQPCFHTLLVGPVHFLAFPTGFGPPVGLRLLSLPPPSRRAGWSDAKPLAPTLPRKAVSLWRGY